MLYIYSFIFVFAFSLASNLWLFYGLKVLDIRQTNMGFPFAAMGLGGVIGAFYGKAIARFLSPLRMLIYSLSLLAVWWLIPAILTPNFFTLPIYCFCLFGNGLSMVCSRVVTSTARQMACPNPVIGQVLAVFSFSAMIVLSVGSIAGGWLAGVWGARIVFVFSSLLYVAAALCCLHKELRQIEIAA